MILTLALALAAASPNRCDISRSIDVAFTSAAATDSAGVRIFGPTCAEAVAVYTVRDAAGALLFVDAVPVSEAAYDAWTPDQGDAALLDLLTPTPERAGRLEPFILESDSGVGGWWATAPEALYERLRADDAPLVCLRNGADMVGCAAYDAETGRATQVAQTAF